MLAASHKMSVRHLWKNEARCWVLLQECKNTSSSFPLRETTLQYGGWLLTLASSGGGDKNDPLLSFKCSWKTAITGTKWPHTWTLFNFSQFETKNNFGSGQATDQWRHSQRRVWCLRFCKYCLVNAVLCWCSYIFIIHLSNHIRIFIYQANHDDPDLIWIRLPRLVSRWVI